MGTTCNMHGGNEKRSEIYGLPGSIKPNIFLDQIIKRKLSQLILSIMQLGDRVFFIRLRNVTIVD
jgi:hypothetical protein